MKRPTYHFTPKKGWINDPNGMVYIDGEYHLFYQHYPDDIVWGPMHWGHAVSKDLLQWEHKAIALYPDDLGYIFSGSCIYDKENVSGLGTKENPPLIAFFTHHNPENGRQQQSIAYSLDKEYFVKYKNNPIISNVEKKDFRDPKVFENPIKGGYTMILAAGPDIEFYHSDNLLDWSYSGSFHAGEHGYGGICECPDCFPLETQEGIKWVLLVSMCRTESDVRKAMDEGRYAGVHMMQYYIGEFDGDKFIDTTKGKEPLLFDFGPDNYAAVTFAGHSDRILMGWGENWNYVTKTEACEYRGKMSGARKLSLTRTEQGYRLCCEIFAPEKYEEKYTVENEAVITIECNTFSVDMSYGKEFVLKFIIDKDQALLFRGNEKEIIVDRSQCGVYSVTKEEEDKLRNYDVLYAPRMLKCGGQAKILYDNGYFEIFAENGLTVFSVMTY